MTLSGYTPSFLLRVSLGAFLVGIAIAYLLMPSFFVVLAALILGFLALVFSVKKKTLCIVGFILFSCAVAFIRVAFEQDVLRVLENESFHPGGAPIHARVISSPTLTSKGQRVVVAFEDSEKIQRRLLLNARQFPLYASGDQLKVECPNFQATREVKSEYFKKSLERKNIRGVCAFPKIEKMGIKNDADIFSRLRGFVITTLRVAHPEPHATLLTGLLIGSVGVFPDALLEAFRRTGMMHVMAVSGYNMTIIAVLLHRFFLFFQLSRKQSIFLVIAGLVFFTLLTGASSSVVRACVMGVLVLLAQSSGRLSSAVNALLFAGAGMVALAPSILLDDLSFQLSFLATAGLLFISPILERFIPKVPYLGVAREALIQTSSAIVCTSPLIALKFGTFSLIAPLANVLLAPLVPFLMAGGAISLILAFASSLMGGGIILSVVAWPVWLLAEIFIQGVQFFSEIPGSSVAFQLDGVGTWLVVCMYGVGAAFVWRASKKRASTFSLA